jgi:beta-aspartyl-peptidase (threonine type)
MKLEGPILVIHGGAGRWLSHKEREAEVIRVLRESLLHGYETLKSDDALEAVVVAVEIMEDSGVFNAGIGSALNLAGYAEMDAGVMDGKSGKAAGVAIVRRVKNPVRLAKYVMERTDHVMVAGEAADTLAKIFGMPERGVIPERLLIRYDELLKKIREGVLPWSKSLEYIKYADMFSMDTVGAVALDSEGNLAAATSTGGIWLKLPGRVGDSPVVGAGFYALNNYAAASATGVGEVILMTQACRELVNLVKAGLNAEEASEKVVSMITSQYGKGNIGIIAVDAKGFVSMKYNTEGMARGFIAENFKKPLIGIFDELRPA